MQTEIHKVRWARLRRLGAVVATAATVGAAVWGAFTGTTVWLDDRRFALSARVEKATVGLDFLPLSRSGRLRRILDSEIDVRIVNGSKRGLTLTEGEVRFQGMLAGRIVGRSIKGKDAALDGPASPLPITVPAETSAAFTLIWEPALAKRALVRRFAWLQGGSSTSGETGSAGGATDVEPAAAAVAVFERFLPIAVRLRFEPDGRWIEEPARLVHFTRAGGGTSRGQSKREVTFRLRRGRPFAIEIDDSDSRPTMVRLELWRDRQPNPTITVRRPLDYNASLPLPRLPRGSYTWSITSEGKVIGTGSFRVPCRDGRMSGRRYDYDMCS